MKKKKISITTEKTGTESKIEWIVLQAKGKKVICTKNSKGKYEERSTNCILDIGCIGFIDFANKDLKDQCFKEIKKVLTKMFKGEQ